MKTKTVNALKDLYIAQGGSFADVAKINNIPDMIESLSTVSLANSVSIEAPDSDLEVFGVKVSQFQYSIMPLGNNNIMPMLIYLDEALWESGPLAGTGYVMAIKVNANFKFDTIKVGLVPSASGMEPVALDEDMIAVFKLQTPEVGTFVFPQKLKIIITIDGVDYEKNYTIRKGA